MVMRFLIALLCLVSGTAFAQTAHSARFTQVNDQGYLGVGAADLTDERVKALNLKDSHGVEITVVGPDTPAAKAGIKENDVILEVNGKAVENNLLFQTLIRATPPGTKIGLTVWRNGAKQSLTATLDARNDFPLGPAIPLGPGAAPPMPPIPPNALAPFPAFPSDTPVVGFWGEALGPQLAEYFGVKQGVLVESVNPNTPASRAGLKAGDVVTKVNGTPVTSAREIIGLVHISGKKSVSFTVVRNKKEMMLNVEIAGIRTDHDDL
jgi:serine protease Do